jgi:NAD-dependent DNA ligase
MIKKIKLNELPYKKNTDESFADESIHRYNIPKLIKKAIQELQGISTVLIYDGKIDDSEIELLKSWLYKNDEYLVEYPLADLKKLFSEIIEDGHITIDERKLLLKFLSSIAASPESNPVVDGIFANKPKIIFNQKNFLFTGNLIYGSRTKAQARVIELGGKCLTHLTMETDYLIVGSLGSEDYKYSRFGTKIENAIKNNREKGTNILIVKEQDFVSAIIIS